MKKLNLLFTLILFLQFGCSVRDESTDDLVATTSEIATSAMLAQVQSTESASIASKSNTTDSLLSKLIPSAYAASCGTFVSDASACAGSTSTWSLGGCSSTFNSATTLSGTLTFIFNTAGACSNAKATGLITMGANNSYTLSSGGGITRTRTTGTTVRTDSNVSGYTTSVSGGSTVTCGGAGCTIGRSVSILGVHRVVRDSSSNVIFDHSIRTTTPLSISGVLGSKIITAGVVELQNNASSFTSTSTITSNLTFSADCCFPTGGSITTTFAGGPLSGQSESITFSSTCGAATVAGNSVTLVHCN